MDCVPEKTDVEVQHSRSEILEYLRLDVHGILDDLHCALDILTAELEGVYKLKSDAVDVTLELYVWAEKSIVEQQRLLQSLCDELHKMSKAIEMLKEDHLAEDEKVITAETHIH